MVVRFFNYSQLYPLSQIKSHLINKFVCLRGTVLRVSSIKVLVESILSEPAQLWPPSDADIRREAQAAVKAAFPETRPALAQLASITAAPQAPPPKGPPPGALPWPQSVSERPAPVPQEPLQPLPPPPQPPAGPPPGEQPPRDWATAGPADW